MNKQPMDNKKLQGFISAQSSAVEGEGNPWEGLDPTGKRVGVSSHGISLNEYERQIINAASAKDGLKIAAFIRQAALKRAKTILGLN